MEEEIKQITQSQKELFDEAVELILAEGKASTSFLQRGLKIGYAKAANILDLLEDSGAIGPQDGNKPREILISSPEELTIDFEVLEEVYPEPEEKEQVVFMGRPRKWEHPNELVQDITSYLQRCADKKEKPNKAGLALHLNTTKHTLGDYENGDRDLPKEQLEEGELNFSDAIKRAYDYIENAWVQRLDNNAQATGPIFYLKNAFHKDYKDKHEFDHTSKGDKIEKINYVIPEGALPINEEEDGDNTDPDA